MLSSQPPTSLPPSTQPSVVGDHPAGHRPCPRNRKAIESGLAANHLPTAPVPSSGSLPAFQSGASSDKAQTAIQSARSNNYPHVKEVLYEYIANKE